MMILLPPWLEALLRHGGRLLLAGALIWLAAEGFAMFGGEARQGGSAGNAGTGVRLSTQSANLLPTPYALLCVPTNHVMQLRAGDASAMEYEVSIQKQVARVIYDLNNPNSNLRRLNPGKGFVIIVHKREDRYTPEKADQGLIALTTTIAYDYNDRDREQSCPPYSVRAKTHPRYRPEFANSSYTASWKPVPTLGRE